MEPADSIRRVGFSRWYERRLIEGHAWFVSGFVCMIAIAACMEVQCSCSNRWRWAPTTPATS